MAYMKYDPEKFIPFEEVEKIWNDNKSENRKIIAHIHNPFCKGRDGKNCKYCIHRGRAGVDNETVEKFYFEYLQKQFKQYENIINDNEFQLISFGGGTPNYLPLEKFSKFLDTLPKKWENVPKLIEMHVAYISKEWIDLLVKYNFKMVVFCVQTFDEETQKEWSRMPPVENLVEIINYARSKGIYPLIDLITCWNNNLKDWDILKNDLEKLKGADVSEISIYPLMQNRIDASVSYLVEKVERYIRDSSFYRFKNECEDLERRIITYACRYFNPKDQEFIKMYRIYLDSLSSSNDLNDEKYPVLAMGSYKGVIHDPYSKPNSETVIYEVNEGDNNAKYYLAKKYNFWDEAIKLIQDLKEQSGNTRVPNLLQLTICNDMLSETPYNSSCFSPCKLKYWLAIPEDKTLKKEFDELTKKIKNVDIDKQEEEYISWLNTITKEGVGEENGICKE